MPAGCGDDEYVGVFQRILVPATRAFRPDFVLVSCGFDAHRDDPLASMQVTGAGFASLAAIVRRLADEVCGGRLAFVLEGGYALTGVREGTAAVLDALTPTEAPPLPRVRGRRPRVENPRTGCGVSAFRQSFAFGSTPHVVVRERRTTRCGVSLRRPKKNTSPTQNLKKSDCSCP